jgi:hypothetical protein
MRFAILALLLCSARLASATGKTTSLPADPAPIDLEGRAFDLAAYDAAPAVVLVFVRRDCPISNRYAPELRRIHDEFAPRGVRFWLVYHGSDDTADSVRRHRAEFTLPLEALRDPGHVLVRASGAQVTPEVAVYAGGQLVYRGRIDDRYSSPGHGKSGPTIHDLADAIQAVLGGHPIRVARTQAVGCSISPPR